MKIAYVRVSTIEQNEARQIETLKKYGIEKWYSEHVSAKDTNREQFQEMISFIREGDTVYVADFSRLARSTTDLLEIVETLNKKKVHLVSAKENLDSNTASGRLMLTMIAAINEFERANLLERQREGIEIAKRNGKYNGRMKKKKPSNWNDVMSKWERREIQSNEAMKLLKIKKTVFYRLLKEEKEKNALL